MKLLLGVLCLVLGVFSLSQEGLVRTGKPIPLHIPTQTVVANDTFEVPYWLGAFYATVELASDWILPPTIGNGGQTYPGEFLFIRNYGPANVTLHPTYPETIEGVSSYSILAGTMIEILSGYPNWIVVTTSTSTQLEQWMHTFTGLRADNSTWFTVEIGTDTYNVPRQPGNVNVDAVSIGANAGSNNTGISVTSIGWYAGESNTGGDVNNLGFLSGRFNLGFDVNNIGRRSGSNNTGWNTNNIGPNSGAANTGNYVNNLGPFAGSQNTGININNIGRNTGVRNTGDNVNNLGSSAGLVNVGTEVNNFGRQAGENNAGSNVNNMGAVAGQNNTGSYCSHNGYFAGSSNTYDYCYTNGRASACTATNQFVFGASLYPLHLRLPSDTGSYCTGAAYDTCLNRAAANSWTFNAGTSLRVPQALNLGATTAPANLATGAFSTTKATPAVQAFGAVTANAASGVLAFTVTTGAGVCGAAVVTNSNVVAGSEVILTIQKYTGQYITNGTPMVTREDAAGSSVGNFNLNLCNIHATNALSGTLYVAFWVLN